MKSNNFTRRKMLAGSVLIAGATPLTALAIEKKPETCCKKDNEPEGFLIGSCDWSMGNMNKPGSFDVAKQIGLDGVQVNTTAMTRNRDMLKTYIEAAKRANVKIASTGIADLYSYSYTTTPGAEKWVSDSIDVTKALNAKVLLIALVGKSDISNNKVAWDETVKRLKKVAPQAEDAGVSLALESWLTAEQLLEIIDEVGSPAIKVYYDVSNSLEKGYDIYKEIRMLGKHISEFHAKDGDVLFGDGKVDFVKVRQACDDIGYRGWMIIEGSTPKGMSIVDAYKYNAKYLRTMFPKIAPIENK
jgi:L-ribulose-5-phosphate 3-epimerase